MLPRYYLVALVPSVRAVPARAIALATAAAALAASSSPRGPTDDAYVSYVRDQGVPGNRAATDQTSIGGSARLSGAKGRPRSN
jgi:hypothetical protein